MRNSPHLSSVSFSGLCIVLLTLFLSLSSAATAGSDRDVVYQISTIDALMAGLYDAAGTCGDLQRNGDLGIGTFTGLDGELVMDRGVVYKVAVDGSVTPMPAGEGVPFAAVTRFDPDISVPVPAIGNMGEFKAFLDKTLPGMNRFHAVRMHGTFARMKTRSVPGQKKPYPPLIEVVKNQAEFERENVRGVLLGFYSPSFVKKINVPGYHFHFISDDRQFGGHVLDLEVSDLTMEIDPSDGFRLQLPDSEAYQRIDFTADQSKDLHKVESDTGRK